MRFDILTLFPGMFSGFVSESIPKLAIQRALIDVKLWNIRDWANDKHRSVDDRPYGGGAGMVLMCQPVFDAVEAVRADSDVPGKLIMLTPQGRRLDQRMVEQFSHEKRLLLLCGRYEGFDERIRLGLEPEEVSIGDYVLSGGELAAMVLVDAIARLIPGVLGDETSTVEESFGKSGMIEYPHYTRPREYGGFGVPEVLLSGNHEEIARWRQKESERRTADRRSDLLKKSKTDDHL